MNGLQKIVLIIFRSLIIACTLLIFCNQFVAAADKETAQIAAKNEQRIESLNSEIARLTKEVDDLSKRTKVNETALQSQEIEYSAAKKLVEISGHNLLAPSFVAGTITAILTLLAGIAMYIIRQGLMKNIEQTAQNLQNTVKDNIDDRFNMLNEKNRKVYSKFARSLQRIISESKERARESEVLLKELHKVTADYCNRQSLKYFKAKRYNSAIEFGEAAVENALEGEANKETNPRKLGHYAYFISNLGYYYAKAKRIDKGRYAMELAGESLDIVLSINAMRKEAKDNIIDNYLYILKFFDKSYEMGAKWIAVYERYSEDLIQSKIWEGNEPEEFKEYYKKILAVMDKLS